MCTILFAIWMAAFLGTKIIESAAPARTYRIRPGWWRWWLGISASGLILSLLANQLWHSTIDARAKPADFGQLIGFYLFYSGLNYWIHRAKHGLLWRLHELHHAPGHMGSELCVWRHPVETLGNLGVLLGLGQLLRTPVEIAAGVLLIEGLLEISHHSNVRTPPRLRWLAGLVQLPEMHLIHYRMGVHRYNYSSVALWDWLFGTAPPIGMSGIRSVCGHGAIGDGSYGGAADEAI